MRRYVETFCRYWLIALAPLIILPLADYVSIRHTPRTQLASANIWVNQFTGDASASQYATPALAEAAILNELLQSPSFDLSVARSSAIYARQLAVVADPATVVAADFGKNMLIVPKGDNLLGISYTSKNWQLGQQVLYGLVSTARDQQQVISQQQTKDSMTYYTSQLHSAKQRLTTSTKRLFAFMDAHNIAPSTLLGQQPLDPTLATLYQQYQTDQSDVATAQRQLSALQAQSGGSVSAAGQSNVRFEDLPSVAVVSSKKTQLMNLGIAVVLGLLLGGGFVVMKTALDRSLRYAEEVTTLLDLPVLAVVPYSTALAGQHTSARQPGGKIGSGSRQNAMERTG